MNPTKQSADHDSGRPRSQPAGQPGSSPMTERRTRVTSPLQEEEGAPHMDSQIRREPRRSESSEDSAAVLLREPVSHLRENRTQLRQEWARRIRQAQLLIAMSKEEIFAEAT